MIYTLRCVRDRKLSMNMNESTVSIITLSSDDEELEKHSKPPTKKMKCSINENFDLVVILSDEEKEEHDNVKSCASNGKSEISKSDSQREKKTVDLTDSPDDKSKAPLPGKEKSVDFNGSVRDDFEAFLKLSASKVENAKHKELLVGKIPTINLLYKRVPEYVETSEFKDSIAHKIKLLNEKPQHALHCFNVIFQQLKYEIKQQKIRVDDTKERHIKRLEKTLHHLHRKIRQLETEEMAVDDLDDEDSAYMKLQKFKERATQVFDKYCELTQKDANTGRITHKRLKFLKSKHECINKAISKKYRNNDRFPTYLDIIKLVKNCVDKNGLDLSPAELETESKCCFEALGNLLQKRRKQDLLDVHKAFIICSEDPAEKNESLAALLRDNKKRGEKKLNNLCHEFVVKQENGEDREMTPEPENKSNSDTDNESELK